MGRDKAFVDVDGVPMVRRVADALLAGGCDIVVAQGGDADRLDALGIATLADEGDHPGPVVAIGLARRRRSGTLVVAACDLPDLTGPVVAELLARSERSGRPAVAGAGGRRHLLVVLPETARERVAAAVAAPVQSYRALLDLIGAEVVDVDAGVVRNVNRPSDLGTRPAAGDGDSLRPR